MLILDQALFTPDEYKKLDGLLKTGQHELMSSMLPYPSPVQIAEIERILAELRPSRVIVQSEAQREFEVWIRKNGESALTPAIEAEWQAKIDAESAATIAGMGAAPTVAGEIPPTMEPVGPTMEVASGEFTGVAGLGAASIQKLKNAGIDTLEKLKELSHDRRVEILNPLVAAKLNYLQ